MFIVNVEAAIYRDGKWLIIERSQLEEHVLSHPLSPPWLKRNLQPGGASEAARAEAVTDSANPGRRNAEPCNITPVETRN